MAVEMSGRSAIAGLMLACAAAGAQAQSSASAPSPPSAATCKATIEALNRGLIDSKRVEAYLSAARFHETGYCVERSEAKAADYLGHAARAGSAVGAQRLARKFARGQGVPQSYAMAGAWLTGKGAGKEPLTAWDYSIGYAYAVLSEVLATVRYPIDALKPVPEAAFVIEVDASLVRNIGLRPTAEDAATRGELYAALQAAFNDRLPEAIKTLAPPEPKFMVQARVAQPVSVRLNDKAALDVLEDEPILR
jgi:hypothetical protein